MMMYFFGVMLIWLFFCHKGTQFFKQQTQQLQQNNYFTDNQLFGFCIIISPVIIWFSDSYAAKEKCRPDVGQHFIIY